MLLRIFGEGIELRLTRTQALKMELALNISTHATGWYKIGNHLYNFHIGKRDEDLHVTREQFETLRSFLN